MKDRRTEEVNDLLEKIGPDQLVCNNLRNVIINGKLNNFSFICNNSNSTKLFNVVLIGSFLIAPFHISCWNEPFVKSIFNKTTN